MPNNLAVRLAFTTEDQAWIRRSSIEVPNFWGGHGQAPVVGDALRFGGRQFVVRGRVWEHDGQTPVLRVFLGSGGAESDTAFVEL
jgi:hypothetical protein